MEQYLPNIVQPLPNTNTLSLIMKMEDDRREQERLNLATDKQNALLKLQSKEAELKIEEHERLKAERNSPAYADALRIKRETEVAGLGSAQAAAESARLATEYKRIEAARTVLKGIDFNQYPAYVQDINERFPNSLVQKWTPLAFTDEAGFKAYQKSFITTTEKFDERSAAKLKLVEVYGKDDVPRVILIDENNPQLLEPDDTLHSKGVENKRRWEAERIEKEKVRREANARSDKSGQQIDFFKIIEGPNLGQLIPIDIKSEEGKRLATQLTTPGNPVRAERVKDVEKDISISTQLKYVAIDKKLQKNPSKEDGKPLADVSNKQKEKDGVPERWVYEPGKFQVPILGSDPGGEWVLRTVTGSSTIPGISSNTPTASEYTEYLNKNYLKKK